VPVVTEGMPCPPIRSGPFRNGVAFLVLIFFYEMSGVTFLCGEIG